MHRPSRGGNRPSLPAAGPHRPALLLPRDVGRTAAAQRTPALTTRTSTATTGTAMPSSRTWVKLKPSNDPTATTSPSPNIWISWSRPPERIGPPLDHPFAPPPSRLAWHRRLPTAPRAAQTRSIPAAPCHLRLKPPLRPTTPPKPISLTPLQRPPHPTAGKHDAKPPRRGSAPGQSPELGPTPGGPDPNAT